MKCTYTGQAISPELEEKINLLGATQRAKFKCYHHLIQAFLNDQSEEFSFHPHLSNQTSSSKEKNTSYVSEVLKKKKSGIFINLGEKDHPAIFNSDDTIFRSKRAFSPSFKSRRAKRQIQPFDMYGKVSGVTSGQNVHDNRRAALPLRLKDSWAVSESCGDSTQPLRWIPVDRSAG